MTNTQRTKHKTRRKKNVFDKLIRRPRKMLATYIIRSVVDPHSRGIRDQTCNGKTL